MLRKIQERVDSFCSHCIFPFRDTWLQEKSGSSASNLTMAARFLANYLTRGKKKNRWVISKRCDRLGHMSAFTQPTWNARYGLPRRRCNNFDANVAPHCEYVIQNSSINCDLPVAQRREVAAEISSMTHQDEDIRPRRSRAWSFHRVVSSITDFVTVFVRASCSLRSCSRDVFCAELFLSRWILLTRDALKTK